MSLPLERWAKQAVLLEREAIDSGKRGVFLSPREVEPVESRKVLDDLRDFAILQRLKRESRVRYRTLMESGEPLNMPESTYGGLLAIPPGATITTTAMSGTANLWPQAVYTPLPANAFLCPQAYRIAVCAKITTSTSPGNIGFDPRIGAGTWTTGGTAITGTTLGATGNVALTASITNAFYYILGDLTVRSIGAPGANAVVVGMFHAMSTQGTSAGLAGPAAVGTGMNLMFGGTSVSFDFTTAQGLGLGAVHTVTTITHNVEQIHWMDWN
jgi:hypothetical protein